MSLVIGLILAGLLLLIIEFFIIPGTTLVGILGSALMIGGIYVAFKNFGMMTGIYATVASLAISGILFWVALKTFRDRLALNDTLEGRVNELDIPFEVGAKGKAYNDLRPLGTIVINNEKYEASSINDYIERGSEIEVIKIEQNKIIVQKLNQA